jgi:hypothetical protein
MLSKAVCLKMPSISERVGRNSSRRTDWNVGHAKLSQNRTFGVSYEISQL